MRDRDIPRSNCFRVYGPRSLRALAIALAFISFHGFAGGQNQNKRHEAPPYWAFAVNPDVKPAAVPPPDEAKPEDTTPRRVPGSDAAFTISQTKDLFSPPDWHPADHPAMPEIVSRGRAPDVYACGYCHLPNGQGRPENSSLAGLPAAYTVQQVKDFRNGVRKSSEPNHGPTNAMISHETKATEQEIQAAAKYFSAIERRPWIRVVETESVPTTHVAGWMLVADEPGEKEPIGERIIETPEDLERTELRDSHSGFIAFVPVGSVKRGKELASGSSIKTLRCATCHGPELRGLGKAPPLAGRSPSYIMRQLFDIQSGARNGAGVQLMKPAVAKLKLEDLLDLAAYTASLRP